MNDSYAGNYPIEHRAGEIERLHVQSQAMAPDCNAMLDRFGDMRERDAPVGTICRAALVSGRRRAREPVEPGPQRAPPLKARQAGQ